MPAALRDRVATARVKAIPKDQIILYEGDRPPQVFVLKRGIVKLYNIDDQGNEKILHLLKPASIMPLAFFSGDSTPTRWYYTALTDCEVYEIPKEALNNLMETDGKVAIYLVNQFSEDVHEVLVRLDSLSKTNVPLKLIAALWYLVACHGISQGKGWWRIPFTVNHQLLSNMMGVSRESTSLAMKSLLDSKVVRNPRLAVLEIHGRRLKAYRQKLLTTDRNGEVAIHP
jgi:CRP/FNR family cyclic AMP-dependent transcriptional regulator